MSTGLKEEQKVTNIKGVYFSKEMGDGTTVSVIRKRRPDDEVWAMAMEFRNGPKVLTCFLETLDGECFVNELADALVDYLYDKSEMEINGEEEDGAAFLLRKAEEAKKAGTKDEYADSTDVELEADKPVTKAKPKAKPKAKGKGKRKNNKRKTVKA